MECLVGIGEVFAEFFGVVCGADIDFEGCGEGELFEWDRDFGGPGGVVFPCGGLEGLEIPGGVPDFSVHRGAHSVDDELVVSGGVCGGEEDLDFVVLPDGAVVWAGLCGWGVVLEFHCQEEGIVFGIGGEPDGDAVCVIEGVMVVDELIGVDDSGGGSEGVRGGVLPGGVLEVSVDGGDGRL